MPMAPPLPAPPPGPLAIQLLFPVALGQVQLRPDPLDLAVQIQELHALRGEAQSNPDPGCAWTGDLNGVWQLHRHPTFAPLASAVAAQARVYLAQLGFTPEACALHLQRCWPVVSEPGQVVGRHHHPNAHLSAVYYLTGDGTGRCGVLRFWPQRQVNELVPGMAVGHQAPLSDHGGDRADWLAVTADVAPRAGLLVLFPAALEHAVLPNDDPDALRCSISFDFVLTAPLMPAGQMPPEYLAPHPSQWTAITEDGTPPA